MLSPREVFRRRLEVPDCATCQCNCTLGFFYAKDIQAIDCYHQLKKENALKQSDKSDAQLAFSRLGRSITECMMDGRDDLLANNEPLDEENLLSAGASALSTRQLQEYDRKLIQDVLPKPSDKLASGRSLRGLLRNRGGKGRRHQSNNLSMLIR